MESREYSLATNSSNLPNFHDTYRYREATLCVRISLGNSEAEIDKHMSLDPKEQGGLLSPFSVIWIRF